jgi:hypothetical protein
MSEVASQSEDPRMKVYRDYFSRTNLGSRTEEIESQIGAEVTIYKPDPKSENPLRRHFYYTEVILPFLDSRIEVRIYAYGDLFHIPTEMQKRGEFPYSTRELLANIVVNELERLIRSVNVDHDQQTLEALETIRTAPKVDMIITHGFTYLPEGEIPLLPMLSVGIRTDVDPLDPMQDKNKMVYAANRWFMRSFPRFSRIIRRLFGEWKMHMEGLFPQTRWLICIACFQTDSAGMFSGSLPVIRML